MSHYTVVNYGSLVAVEPRTKACTRWLRRHTAGTWWHGALMVEPRYLLGLVEGLREEGFR